jgi:predicted lipoprotein with Yx(FWY)xxD motif
MMRSGVCALALTALAAGWVSNLGAQEAAATVTPPEITIAGTPVGPVFADVDGYTLYVTRRDTDPSVSTCFEACATEWPPVRASAGAEPFGDWSLVERPDGAPQWAYTGRPLYRYRWEEDTNWAIGQGDLWQYATVDPFPVGGARRRGYSRTAFVPTSFSVTGTPAGIYAETTPLGVVLTDATGMTLYVAPADCGPTCGFPWAPVPAPAAAAAVGDWSVVPRADGTGQWAYQGQPLHSCVLDAKPGEATCVHDGGEVVQVPPTLTAPLLQRPG